MQGSVSKKVALPEHRLKRRVFMNAREAHGNKSTHGNLFWKFAIKEAARDTFTRILHDY